MNPYPVRSKEFSIDPYYASVNFHIYSIKVIPIPDKCAKIFPPWNERKQLWFELVFDPFALEMVILLHHDQNIETTPGQPRGKTPLDGVIICPSYFTPEMVSETQEYVTLHRVSGVQDRLLGFHDNPSPSNSPQSLTSKIADDIIVSLTAISKEENPSLELCFENNADAKAFLHAWNLAFGREVDQAQHKRCTDILDLSRGTSSQPPPIDSVPRDHVGTPVSLQTETNASGLILPPLMHEKKLFLRESSLAAQERVFYSVPCHDYGDGTTDSLRILEVFLPHDKFGECQMFKYPKLFWWVKVTSVVRSSNIPSREISMKIKDSSTITLREPLLPFGDRQKFLGALRQDGTIDKWVEGNEKKQYWCLKLLFPFRDFTSAGQRQTETRLKLVNLKFPTKFCLAAYKKHTQGINDFPKDSPTFNVQGARAIEEVFLGHRLGRLLPHDVAQRANQVPPRLLLVEQAKIYNHVLNHDFTLVDGAPATGKSKVTKEIIIGFFLQGKQVLVMSAAELALESLARNVLSDIPNIDPRAAEAIAKLRPLAGKKQGIGCSSEDIMMESINVDVLFAKSSGFAGRSLDLNPFAVEAKLQIAKASLIFMTVKMAERVDPFYGLSKRKFDLIVLDDANLCGESTGLLLTQHAFADAPRWLVIGCSRGISPVVNVDEFKEMEICGSWFNRLLRHPEFRLNALRLTKQGRVRKSLYEPINNMFFNGTITPTADTPREVGDNPLCMGFVNTSRICKADKRKPEHDDEEFLAAIHFEREQQCVLHMAQKIHTLTPHASIVILCYAEPQNLHMRVELKRIGGLKRARIFTETIDNFANEEVDYTIIHVPLWKGSYQYSDDQGRFLIAMTRARKGVFAIGNLATLAECEKKRNAWATNPWRNWLIELNKSKNGAVFEDVTEIDLEATFREISSFKNSRVDLGLWLGQKYTKEEIERLRNYW